MPEALYHAAARARRRWFQHHPDARRVLRQPVISVGNLTFGGSGKTPIVAAIVRLLQERGERPAVLSRGYGRRSGDEGVVLVSDGDRILADVDRAGDEPLMLARALPGAIVSVSSLRYLAGRLAELHCGATVHILDDGFQHLGLARDVDLLVLDGREQVESSTPLREDPAAISAADALLLGRGAVMDRLPSKPIFRWSRALDDPIDIGDVALATEHGRMTLDRVGPVLAIAGIAVPQRFFDDLRHVGVDVRATISFSDHHRFTPTDVARIGKTARAEGCAAVLTTEKDATRLRRFRPLPVRLLAVPLRIAFDPPEHLGGWLTDRLAFARTRRRAA